MRPKRILVSAGPNGAGKTTFARAFLPQEAHCPRFVNADVIRRRFAAGRANFDRYYRDVVDDWVLYDNADDEPRPLDRKQRP